MHLVALTALGVGGATVLGALIGFVIGKVPHKYNDAILGFAAGVMLAASFVGLISPAMERGGVWVTVIGLFFGAAFLNLMDKFTPHLHHLAGMDQETHRNNAALQKVLLFVIAIAIHNLPEGIAAGVSFGTEDTAAALTVAAGIALQNVPEGMVIIGPLLTAGVSRRRTFVIALATGLVEVVGTFLGYFAVHLVSSLLPFALAFAGGTMLYVISDEMIPETHAHGYERMATFSLLAGIAVMLIMDFYIG